MSKELQDYKVKSVFETERLEDYKRGKITREEGLQKSFLGRGESCLLWTSILDLCPFKDELNYGKSSKVTWVGKIKPIVNLSAETCRTM